MRVTGLRSLLALIGLKGGTTPCAPWLCQGVSQLVQAVRDASLRFLPPKYARASCFACCCLRASAAWLPGAACLLTEPAFSCRTLRLARRQRRTANAGSPAQWHASTSCAPGTAVPPRPRGRRPSASSVLWQATTSDWQGHSATTPCSTNAHSPYLVFCLL